MSRKDGTMGRSNENPEDREDARPSGSVAFLDDILRRIVRVAAPERIILFGSAARGDAGPESDIDLLVVKSGDFHRGRLTEAIYEGLIGAGRSVDVVVVTPDDIDRYGHSPALVIAAALREGHEVYAAAA